MVNAELLFEAYLSAAIPYIDKKWLADPIVHTFILLIKNQSNQTLYFKLFNAIPNWDFGTSLPGSDEKALGSITAGNQVMFAIDVVREVPIGETYDGGNLTLKAYTDAGYSNEIATDDLYATIDIQDVESWTDVTIFNFDDGTAQGWTLSSNVSISSDKSVEAGGYSARYYVPYASGSGWYSVSSYMQKSLSIPNRNKCTLAMFLTWYALTVAVSGIYINVYADGVLIFTIPVLPNVTQTIWHKISINLSALKGMTKIIKIEWCASIQRGYGPPTLIVWTDRIVLAGKD